MMKKKWKRDKKFDLFSLKLTIFSLEIFILCFGFLNLPRVGIGEVFAGQSTNALKDEVRATFRKLSVSLIEPLSKNDIDTIETTVNETFLEADKEGKPIHFGIGVLDRNGMAVAGGYIVGAFKGQDFSKYDFVKKVLKKKKKIVQDRLYFQDHSELLVICAPLVRQKKIIGAIVLGFNPTQVKNDYGLGVKQFLAVDFNK